MSENRWYGAIIIKSEDDCKLSSNEEFKTLVAKFFKGWLGGAVLYHSSDLPMGEFPELEIFLVENKISFKRVSSGYMEYSPETRGYIPEEEIDITYQTTNAGEPVIKLDTMSEKLRTEEGIAQLKAYAELCKHTEEVLNSYENLP